MNGNYIKITNIIVLTIWCVATSVTAAAEGNLPAIPEVPGPEVERSKVEAEYLAKARQGAEEHRKADATFIFVDAQGQPLAGVPVRIRQTKLEFLFGCIAFDLPRSSEKERWKERFGRLFNFAILPFYWANYEKTQGDPQHESLTQTLDWCRERGITTKGHPLVWQCHPAGQPSWLTQASRTEVDMITGEQREVVTTAPRYSKEEVEQMQFDRVRRELSHFAGRIDIWDVYNEAAWWLRAGAPGKADFCEKAFRAAREANPQATLILNDEGMYEDKARRDGLYQLVSRLQQRGAPIDAVGFQSHAPKEVWWMPERVVKTLDLFKELDLPIHITEVIAVSNGEPIKGGWREGNWTEEAQADFAEFYYRIWFGHPSVASINWWGLSDRDIWKPKGGLIDEQYNPKPVYDRLDQLINQEWKTNVDLETDEQGRVTFRGFHGEYEISIPMPDGRTDTRQAIITRNGDNQKRFTVN